MLPSHASGKSSTPQRTGCRSWHVRKLPRSPPQSGTRSFAKALNYPRLHDLQYLGSCVMVGNETPCSSRHSNDSSRDVAVFVTIQTSQTSIVIIVLCYSTSQFIIYLLLVLVSDKEVSCTCELHGLPYDRPDDRSTDRGRNVLLPSV